MLLSRLMWMDEVHSWLIVSDTDLSHAMHALADGVDFNPPTWFVITRWLAMATGEVTEVRLRLISLFWMMAALAGVFLLLAKHFGSLASATAVLLTACHPLLVHQSTEIRFYGFWCACVSWLCVIIQYRPSSPGLRILQAIGAALLAGLTATCHYFGILSLGLIALPLVVRYTPDRSGFRLAAVILISGGTLLLCCLPFLSGQKASLTRPTWISPPTIGDSLLFLQAMLPAWQIVVCVVAAIISIMCSRRTLADPFFRRLPDSTRELWSLASLTLMPIVIVAVSWLIQPALVTRYAVVAVPAMAVGFAIAVYQCSVRTQVATLIMATGGFSYAVSSYESQWNSEQAYQKTLSQHLSRSDSSDLILFEDRIEWLPLVHYHPELRTFCKLADFTDNQLLEDSTLKIVQRDVGRRIQKWYPDFRLQALNDLGAQPSFWVVPYALEEPGLRYPAESKSQTEALPLREYYQASTGDTRETQSARR